MKEIDVVDLINGMDTVILTEKKISGLEESTSVTGMRLEFVRESWGKASWDVVTCNGQTDEEKIKIISDALSDKIKRDTAIHVTRVFVMIFNGDIVPGDWLGYMSSGKYSFDLIKDNGMLRIGKIKHKEN